MSNTFKKEELEECFTEAIEAINRKPEPLSLGESVITSVAYTGVSTDCGTIVLDDGRIATVKLSIVVLE